MLSQMDPALVSYCEKIAEDGGPLTLPEDIAGSSFQQVPVVQMATTTRASARLRHVQPEVDYDKGYEALKRPKKTVDPSHTGYYIHTFFFIYYYFIGRRIGRCEHFT